MISLYHRPTGWIVQANRNDWAGRLSGWADPVDDIPPHLIEVIHRGRVYLMFVACLREVERG